MAEPTKVNIPSDFLGAITEELKVSLKENERELLSILGFSEFLCCLSVANHERAAGRICVPVEKADRVRSLINSMELHCYRSAFDLLPQPDFHEGKHVTHHAVYVPQDSREGACAVVYFGIDAEFAQGAEAAELNKEQRLVGRLFGYPECCSEFFLDGEGFNQDRTLGGIHDTGPFPVILNPLLPELYGVRLTFHFVCSPRCRQSLRMAQERLERLKQYAPSIAEIESLGAGIVLYGPTIGASLITRYKQVSHNTYAVEEVTTWHDAGGKLFSDKEPAWIRLHSANEFEVEGRSFSDNLHFAALFSEYAFH